jgi:hypothetical protein
MGGAVFEAACGEKKPVRHDERPLCFIIAV